MKNRASHIHGHLGAGFAIDEQGRIVQSSSRLARTVLRAGSHGLSLKRSKNWHSAIVKQKTEFQEEVLYTLPIGRIYVANSNADEIRYYTITGVELGGFGESGTGDGQFDDPSAIARDSENNLFVVDRGNDRVQKFGKDGTYLDEFSTPSGQPYGICIDNSDNIYVTDRSNWCAYTFNHSGTLQNTWGEYDDGSEDELQSPRHLDFNPVNSYLYVTSSGDHYVKVYNTSGTHQFNIGGYGNHVEGKFDTPVGICVNLDGDIWVSGFHSVPRWVQKLDKDGTYITKIVGSDATINATPWGLVTDASDYLYVVSWQFTTSNINRYTDDAEWVRRWDEARGLDQAYDVEFVPLQA